MVAQLRSNVTKIYTEHVAMQVVLVRNEKKYGQGGLCKCCCLFLGGGAMMTADGGVSPQNRGVCFH